MSAEKKIQCSQCGGSGICANCAVAGYSIAGYFFMRPNRCRLCSGSGRCSYCNGSGWVLLPSLGKVDISCSSLGVKTVNGVFYPVVTMGNPLPVTKELLFNTAVGNQNDIELHFLIRSETNIADNELLRKVSFGELSPSPKEATQIKLTIQIDQDGEVLLTAKDAATGKNITITEA